jgi:hypothetical protein
MDVKIKGKALPFKLSAGDVVVFGANSGYPWSYLVSPVPQDVYKYELIALNDGSRAYEEPMEMGKLISRIMEYGGDVQIYNYKDYRITIEPKEGD